MTTQPTLTHAMERSASPLAAAPVVNGLLALYTGVLSSQTPGWELLESKEGEMVQVPFEGSYASKGGRIQSPWIDLDKPAGIPAYYRMTFSAQTDAQCYWWVDFQDGEGNPLPDVNSAVYAGETEQAYDQMIYVMGAAARIPVQHLLQIGTKRREQVGYRTDFRFVVGGKQRVAGVEIGRAHV